MNNIGESTEAEITRDEIFVVRPATENYEAMSFDYSDVSILKKFENWLHLDGKELWRFDAFTNEFLGR